MTDFSESYARGLLLGMSQYLHHVDAAWNIRRLQRTSNYKIKDIVKFAKDVKADAIIGQFNEDDDVELFKKAGIIAIAQDFKKSFKKIPNIVGEYYKSGYESARYFINKGFHNFAFYGAEGVEWSEERKNGFKDMILGANRGFTMSELNAPGVDIWNNNLSNIEKWIIELPKPVAIMACDDSHAFDLSEVCRLLRYNAEVDTIRVPQDVSILGVDNDESICMLSSPMLSSLEQDVERGGWRVARFIDDVLSGRQKLEDAKDLIIPITRIITRQSTDVFICQDDHVSNALKYIHEHINQKICVDDIVKIVPLSRRLLEVRFMKEMGTSIYEYILRVRIEKISELLQQGVSVSDAAFELGFNDVKNLSRVFKKIQGMSPSEYKKMKTK